MLLALLSALIALAPVVAAEPPMRVPEPVTDPAGALTPADRDRVQQAVDGLYDTRRVRLWVVYVDDFDDRNADSWGDRTLSLSNFGDRDALLAVAVAQGEFVFRVPRSVASDSRIDDILVDGVEPRLRTRDWAGAAVAAATGLQTDSESSGSGVPWPAVLVILAVLAVFVVLLTVVARRRRRARRKAEVAAAQRVDATDPAALAPFSTDALDDLSKAIVVDVDNAVRTSEEELALAEGEFGASETEPFRAAVSAARTALAQAFSARQLLDDEAPESPQQRRDMLLQVIVAAARADRELDRQSDAFEALRNLLIDAPSRLDALTQQVVALTARLAPAESTLADLRGQFSESALASVADNVDEARQRLAFADQQISTARGLVARPAGDQTGLIDALRAAESALAQADTLLDAVDTAARDINRAVTGLAAAIADLQAGIDAASEQLRQPQTPHAETLARARDQAAAAVEHARTRGQDDPLGAFHRLSAADAELDRLLAEAAQQREATERLTRTFEQALFAAQARTKAVADYIDTRRGTIGPEARTRLAEAVRQLEAATAKRDSNIAEALAHANGAATLAAQAQTLANDDVRAAQQSFTGGDYGGGSGGGSGDLGAMLGGIVIGSVLRGGFSGGSGWGGSFGGGRGLGRSTSFGGASRSSGRSYGGHGGRSGRF